MRFAVIIPARYESSRFPGKPLIDLAGKSMIRRVWDRCARAVGEDLVYVATDDQRILEHCSAFTSNALMTSDDCLTGTDRVAEVAEHLQLECAVNVQGDEPLINPDDILKVLHAYQNGGGRIVNAMCPIDSENEFFSLTIPKVVCSESGKLLYMSRAPIPGNKNAEFRWGYKQVCIYAFPREALAEFAAAPGKYPLEEQEDIEILRFLELGYEVQMVKLAGGSVAVDTPEDRDRVIGIINDQR